MTGTRSAQAVFVVGGGIQGLLTADALSRAGTRVVVLDRGAARQASWAGGGILSPLNPWRYTDAITRLSVWSQEAYPALSEELIAKTGISPQYAASGMVILAVDVAKATAWASRYRTPLETLDADAIERVAPGVAMAGDAILLPNVAHIRSPRLLEALRAALVHAGVEIRVGVEVEDFLVNNGRLSGLRTSLGEISAARCVVAAGAWTGAMIARSGLDLPINPVCGQMLLIDGRALNLTRMVLKESHYLIPRLDGLVLVGSTIEYRGFDRSTTANAREILAAAAADIFPAAAGCPIVDQWAALRPGSPDGVPFIGAHPHIDGLFINAGHFRNGIVLAPASARLVTDLMLGRPPIVDPAPYSPALPRAV